jgi:hypothetical protein
MRHKKEDEHDLVCCLLWLGNVGGKREPLQLASGLKRDAENHEGKFASGAIWREIGH